jgi:predicted transcriptional regulator
MMTFALLDRRVRLFVYRQIVDAGRFSAVDEVAAALSQSRSEIAASFRRLWPSGRNRTSIAGANCGEPHAVRS